MHRRAACGLRGASDAVPAAFHATASRSCGRRQSCSVWAACICLRFQLGERKWRMQSVAAHAKSGKEGWRVQVTEDHPNPEDVFLGPEAFRSPDICPPRQEASARAGARFADVTSSILQTNPHALCNFHCRRPRASLASRRCMNSLSGAGPVRGRIQRPSVSAGSDLRISKASWPSE